MLPVEELVNNISMCITSQHKFDLLLKVDSEIKKNSLMVLVTFKLREKEIKLITVYERNFKQNKHKKTK